MARTKVGVRSEKVKKRGLSPAPAKDDKKEANDTMTKAKRQRRDYENASTVKPKPHQSVANNVPKVAFVSKGPVSYTAGTLYSFGMNTCGQLAFNPDVVEKRIFPALCESFKNSKLDVIAVAAGGMHSAVLTSKGEVYTFGSNDEGALGRPFDSENSEEESAQPGKVSLPGKAVAITAGSSHTTALLEGGSVYCWGTFRDGHGHYGLVPADAHENNNSKCHMKPVQIQLQDGVIARSIASANDHVVILTEDGKVLTFGSSLDLLGRPGRLTRRTVDINEKTINLTPTVVSVPGRKKFKEIYCGSSSTFCVEDSKLQTVWAFGMNSMFQLGFTEPAEKMIMTPIKAGSVTVLQFVKIVIGEYHCLGLDAEGKVYSWGKPYEGQLGLGDSTPKEPISQPMVVDTLSKDKKIVDIACGHSVSYALTDKGEVYSWGFGENFQLGTKRDQEDALAPEMVLAKIRGEPARKIHCVSAGGQHALMVAEPGLGLEENMEVD